MRTEFFSKSYKETNTLINVCSKKLNKLDKFTESDSVAKVKLETTGGKYTMEVTITTGGKQVRAEVTTDNMYDNIDILIPKLEAQLKKLERRLKGTKTPEFAAEENAPAAPAGKVVKIKKFDISIISVEDAIAELEMLDHSFHVFLNADTNKVCVLYKRNDGDYGLIEPEY